MLSSSSRMNSLFVSGPKIVGLLALAALLGAVQPAVAAVQRTVTIDMPAAAGAGSPVTGIISVTTTAADEQIGFFQAEYSVDGGKKWVSICYDTDAGPAAVRNVSFTAGPAGSVALVRVRIAFRSKAGDVDFEGNPIKWDDTWGKWVKPPAKYAKVLVGS